MPTLRNVLIVTQSFPPHNNIAARRFGYLAPYLEAAGWRPWVLTMHADGPLPVLLPPEQILRVGRHPESPGGLSEKGVKIASAPVRRGLSSRGERLRRALAVARLRFRAVDYTCLTWRREVLRQEDTLRAMLPPIDLVLGTFGPAASIWLARHFAKKLDVPWVADFRDLAALRPDDRGRLAQWLDRRIERRQLRSAVGLTTVSPTLRKILRRVYRRPVRAIFNGWDTYLPSPDMREKGRGRYLYYAGRFYPERAGSATLILDALAACPGVSWKIRSLGPTTLEERLLAEAGKRGVADRVELLPPAPPDQVQAESAAALANVVLDGVRVGAEWARGTLTGKFLELVAMDPPVLAVTRPDSDMGPILRRTAKGRVCSTAEELIRFVETIRSGVETFAGDRDQIERYSKRRQAAALGRFFDTLVANGPSRQGE